MLMDSGSMMGGGGMMMIGDFSGEAKAVKQPAMLPSMLVKRGSVAPPRE